MRKEIKTRAVIGLFWGDEGKAKAVDVLGEKTHIVARFQGGANAGHTVHVKGQKYVFHQIPSGILREGVTGVLGSGMVLDLPQLVEEIKQLQARGIGAFGRLIVAPNVHLVTAIHKAIEKAQEKSQGIGTTLRGIGPAYADKYSRRGIRLGELIQKDNLEQRAKDLIEAHKRNLEAAGETVPTVEDILKPLVATAPLISELVDDVSLFLNEAICDGKNVLIEGAQGCMLDIDWGTYPFVTSSSTGLSGVASGLGIDPRKIQEVVGIVKAFTSRVGNGPFPTEVFGGEGERLRGTGSNDWDEFGSTTGRPRRCGWLDGFVLHTNCMRWGVDKLFITKLDVLDGIETIKICSGYRINGHVVCAYPSTATELDKVEPIYEEIEGWKSGVTGAKRFDDLPENAQYYIKRIEQLAGCPVGWISTGAGREDTIVV